jgi:hypothetical protein
MGEWRYSTTIIDLGTTWMSVASFTPRMLYPRTNNPLDVVDKRKIISCR